MIRRVNMFYYNQRNYGQTQYNKPNGTKTTIAKGGCGVVSTCIVVNNLLGSELYSVPAMRDLAQSTGARTNNGTNVTTLLKAICKKHPEFTFKTTSSNKELLTHLKAGGMALINQGNRYNVFSNSGHYVAAVKLLSNSVVDVYDPDMYSGKYSAYGRKSKIKAATKYGAQVHIDEISKATQDRNPCYWLVSCKVKKPATTKSSSSFKVGQKVSLLCNLKVRTGAGTQYSQKKRSQLTLDGRLHSLHQTMAVLKKGAKVTIKEVKKVNSDIWIKVPSGWIAAYYSGKAMVK